MSTGAIDNRHRCGQVRQRFRRRDRHGHADDTSGVGRRASSTDRANGGSGREVRGVRAAKRDAVEGEHAISGIGQCRRQSARSTGRYSCTETQGPRRAPGWNHGGSTQRYAAECRPQTQRR
jgi:hypothetical protein